VLEVLWFALDPSAATGVLLDHLAQIIGLTRIPASYSTAVLTLSGDPGTVIPEGTEFSQQDSGDLFVLDAEVTLAPAVSTGNITAVEPGPIAALSGTITSIETPVTGLEDATNAADATLGRNRETDGELRRRMVEDLQKAGNNTADAIRGRLRELDGVIGASVVENWSDEEDSAGRPSRSYEAYVYGGTDTDIAEILWSNKPSGMRMVHSTQGGAEHVLTIQDAAGEDQTVRYTEPEQLDVYLRLTTTPAISMSAQQLTDFKESVTTFSQQAQGIGTDVIHYKYLYEIRDILADMGWSDLTDINLEFGAVYPASIEENLSVEQYQVARIESANIELS
jgi:uncharacterized phage protein gp47/JayE